MSATKPTVLLEHYLKQLKLPTSLCEYEKVVVVCQQHQVDYKTLLLRLAELETIDCDRRAAEGRLKANVFTRDASGRFPIPQQDWRSTAFPLNGGEHLRHVCAAPAGDSAYRQLVTAGGVA